MKANLGNLKLNSPIITASGTFGFGEEFSSFVDFNKVGAIVTKGMTLKPRSGNKGNRIHETSAGMLNCIGLENPGVDKFLTEILPRILTYNCPIIANISGSSIEEYGILASKLDVLGVSAIELNVSCPNVKDGGIVFGTDYKMLGKVVKLARENTKKPLIVKLSPNVTDITQIARAAQENGADILSLINTLTGMAINIKTKEPILGNVTGGLSGPCVKPIAIYLINKVRQVVDIPIIGMGGIKDIKDVIEFFLAGASAVAVGTMNMVRPNLINTLYDQLEEYLKQENIKNYLDLVGKVKI